MGSNRLLKIINFRVNIYLINYTIVNKTAIDIIGITTRTSNELAMQEIPKLWQKFYLQDIKKIIPNKKSDTVYALCIDYEKDITKPYSLVIGCEVISLDTIPEGMVGKTIPQAKYAVFLANEKQPEAIISPWQQIWHTQLARTYTGDFELYDPHSNSKAEIYVAVK
jgi:predicted transcriptional regulator YdeE